MKMKTLSKTMVFFAFLFSTSTADAQIIRRVWKFVTIPFQPIYGAYSDGESNKTAPVTTFDRGVFYDQRERIKVKVADPNDHYRLIYQTIYFHALTTSPSITCGYGDGEVCGTALLAKNAAFVYLMGFDGSGGTLDETTTPKRSEFYDKAVFILDKCDDEDRYGSFVRKNNQSFRADELVMLLQAHDYLMTAKSIELDYHDADQTASKESLVEFTHRLYRRADNDLGGALGAYNNTTLKVASS